MKEDVLFPPQMVKVGMFLAGPKCYDGHKNDKSTVELQMVALLSANYRMWSTLYPGVCLVFCRQLRFRGKAWACQKAVN